MVIKGKRIPLDKVISVSLYKGKRVGEHPLKEKLYKKKHPVLYSWWGYSTEIDRWFRWWEEPYLKVWLSTRDNPIDIPCKSNLEATIIRDKILKGDT